MSKVDNSNIVWIEGTDPTFFETLQGNKDILQENYSVLNMKKFSRALRENKDKKVEGVLYRKSGHDGKQGECMCAMGAYLKETACELGGTEEKAIMKAMQYNSTLTSVAKSLMTVENTEFYDKPIEEVTQLLGFPIVRLRNKKHFTGENKNGFDLQQAPPPKSMYANTLDGLVMSKNDAKLNDFVEMADAFDAIFQPKLYKYNMEQSSAV